MGDLADIVSKKVETVKIIKSCHGKITDFKSQNLMHKSATWWLTNF